MTPPIGATRPSVLGCCVACLLAQPHATHDTALPVVQRSTVTAPAPRKSDPDLLGYLAEAVPPYPAI